MKRVLPAAAALVVLAARLVPAQEPSFELALSHVVNEAEVASTRLAVSPSEIRCKGTIKGRDGIPATELMALLQRDSAGGFLRYDRDVRVVKDGTQLAAVTVLAEDSRFSFRERGPLGSRTKSVMGPPIDLVIDAACPEVLIPFLLDASRKSVRVLTLPELEVKTVVFEDRGAGARYALVPGGGVTLVLDGAGAFAKLALPGPEARVIVPSAVASRPVPPRANESRVVLDRGDDVRIAFTLTLPSGGTPPFPAVVMVGDAGPRDRNGVGGGSVVPTLRLLSDALASAGVATVRADKRGAGESKGPEPGLASLAADLRALVDATAAHPSVDPLRVFLAGHGEGALVASELARSSPEGIAGVITLASPARPLAEALEAKLRVRLAAGGQLPDAIENAVATLRSEMDALRQLPESGPVPPGQALFRDLVRIDPAVLAASIHAPLLILHAGDDRETPASQVALMRASLAFSADRARFEIVDGADHDLLRSPASASMTETPPSSADVARELHPRIPAAIREFIERAPAETRPSRR
jgi:pimeloyl-ACP methyl ester carboxylesterase